MRDFRDYSQDTQETAQDQPVRSFEQADTAGELQEQTEEQAEMQPEMPEEAVEVPEQTEAEAELDDRRGSIEEGVDVAEEGIELPEEGVASDASLDTASIEAETMGGMASADLGQMTEEGVQTGHPDVNSDQEFAGSTGQQDAVEHRNPQDMSEVQGWLGDINPNFDEFDPESPYCNNCGSCALAVYKRLEGDTESCAGADNIGYNSEMEAITGMEQVSMDPSEIEQALLEQGDGAHAIIGIDRAEGPGHWFNAACIDGKVVAIDGQTGEITDWPPDYGDVVNWEMSVKRK